MNLRVYGLTHRRIETTAIRQSVNSSYPRRLRLLPVLEEPLEADVGERVLEALFDHRGRRSRDIGAHPRSLDDVDGMAHARHQYLGGQVGAVEDVDDLAHQVVQAIQR